MNGMRGLVRKGEVWHVPVYEECFTKERVILLSDFKEIEQDMYEHLAEIINRVGIGKSTFRKFEKRNGLKMWEHTKLNKKTNSDK